MLPELVGLPHHWTMDARISSWCYRGSLILGEAMDLLFPILGLAVYLIARPRDATDTFHANSAATVDNEERLRGTHPF